VLFLLLGGRRARAVRAARSRVKRPITGKMQLAWEGKADRECHALAFLLLPKICL
jgi:hypothetical protein